MSVLTRKSTSQPVPPLQRALRVGSSTDPLEAEADAVADRVLRMSATEVLQRCPGGCPGDEELRRRPAGDHGDAFALPADTAARVESARRGGQALPASVRGFFEPRFGADFSSVRVHADEQAAGLAAAVNARAFTVGNDVFFGAGELRPGTPGGDRLLAHELSHTLQQQSGGAAGTPMVVQRAAPAALAVVAWCLKGAAGTLALDLIANNLERIGWEARRAAPMIAGPTRALGAGGGFSGAMERDRRRLLQDMPRSGPARPPWVFNKCTALLSVLVGCVFGVAGGAVRQWLVQMGRWTGKGVVELLKKAGYEQALGKWGLVIAKLGCEDQPLDDVEPRSAEEVRPELGDLVEPRTAGGEAEPSAGSAGAEAEGAAGMSAGEEGGMCYPIVGSSGDVEELVCREPR